MNPGPLLARLSHGIERVAAVLLAAITLLVVASAVGRYGLAMPIPDAFDLSRLLLGAAVMWGFASLGLGGGHIRVDLFAQAAPPAVRRSIEVLSWLVLLGFTVLLVVMMYTRVRGAYASGEATFDLRLPLWPFFGLIWLGAVVSLVTILARIAMLVGGSQDPDGDAADGDGERTGGDGVL